MNPKSNGFQFDPAKHRYLLDGRAILSVTQVLRAAGIAPDFNHVEPGVLEHKRRIGVALHKCLHFLQEDDLDPESVDEELRPHLEAYRLFLADTGFKATSIELRKCAKLNRMDFAGTLDVLGLMRGKPTIIDFKSAESVPHPAWGVQLSAYEQMIEAPLIPPFHYHRYSLQLMENGKYRLTEWNDPSDLDVFRWALALTWWKLNHGENTWE